MYFARRGNSGASPALMSSLMLTGRYRVDQISRSSDGRAER